MECNLNDFTFDTYFAALLTPIELAENDTIEKLPPINTLGASYNAGSSIFSSLNNSHLFAESAYMKNIKNEEFSAELSSSASALDEHFLEETRINREEIDSLDSPTSHITEEEIINSPIPIKQENVEIVKICNSPTSNSSEKKLKRSRAGAEEDSGKEGSQKKRRVNYCFDIHRSFCPHSKKEKYYCNVSLQGKLQETVDLVKGKRGKYAYTFYDQRKQRKERRYWPSQSCGPVIEDGCSCERCNIEVVKKPIAATLVERSETTTTAPAAHKNDDNCVIFLEEVFLDM